MTSGDYRCRKLTQNWYVYDPKKDAYHPSDWEYSLPYSEITTTSWFMDAADVSRPVLKGAALVGSFIPVTAPAAIPLSIALNGTDLYASGASWGQIGKQVGIEAGVTLATLGLFKGAGMLATRSTTVAEGRVAAMVESRLLADAETYVYTGARQLPKGGGSLGTEATYEWIRNLPAQTNIETVARNTGLPDWYVESIRNHIFFDEHLLPNEAGIVGMNRFTPDPEIAR